MFRSVLLGAVMLAGPAVAQNTCEWTGDARNCTRILACVGDTRWFEGRSVGWDQGTLAGTMSDGAICSGTWVQRNWMGVGEARVSCDDGMEATVLYSSQDSITGTARGGGEANTGEWIQAWSGEHVTRYLEAETGRVLTLPCEFGDVPIG